MILNVWDPILVYSVQNISCFSPPFPQLKVSRCSGNISDSQSIFIFQVHTMTASTVTVCLLDLSIKAQVAQCRLAPRARGRLLQVRSQGWRTHVCKTPATTEGSMEQSTAQELMSHLRLYCTVLIQTVISYLYSCIALNQQMCVYLH